MKYHKRLTFFCCLFILCAHNLKAQSTPEELGKFVFESFRQNSIGKIDGLIPTLAEMKKIAEQLGIRKDSDQYIEMLKGRDAQIEEFHENINLIYSDTLGNGLNWKIIKLEKVVTAIDSIQVDNRNVNSKRVPVAIVKIYFTSNSSRFIIGLDDVFPSGSLWRIGNSIYIRQMK